MKLFRDFIGALKLVAARMHSLAREIKEYREFMENSAKKDIEFRSSLQNNISRFMQDIKKEQ